MMDQEASFPDPSMMKCCCSGSGLKGTPEVSHFHSFSTDRDILMGFAFENQNMSEKNATKKSALIIFSRFTLKGEIGSECRI